MYAYCLNNPVLFKDGNGMRCHAAYAVELDVHRDVYVRHYVPLYDQYGYNICWALCQIMVQDYLSGAVQTLESAFIEAKCLARLVNGKDWNRGAYPTNCAEYSTNNRPIITTDIDSVDDLYVYLKDAPMYAVYKTTKPNSKGDHGYHMVVVTGVNVTLGIVYTNNPWEAAGVQYYDDFLNGFAGMESAKPYQLDYYIQIKH